VLGRTVAGDLVLFTDWRGDPDELLVGAGTEVVEVLSGLPKRGVIVRGLIWRSHPNQIHVSEQENLEFAEVINEAGGEVFLDERVRRVGSHHQKLVVVRYRGRPDDDVAFVGGIDLCHGRNDDARHHGDPEAVTIDDRYGLRPACHDLQMEIRGPVISDLTEAFRERWEDPLPLDRGPWRHHLARAAAQPVRPSPLPVATEAPGEIGPHAIQVLRTYPANRQSHILTRSLHEVLRVYRRHTRAPTKPGAIQG
jgi:phosphatidylserine/phosphatidylglycerophosphate/cardiolipin synthase-like enzyme